jgi:hypothetical protein
LTVVASYAEVDQFKPGQLFVMGVVHVTGFSHWFR